MLKSGLNFTKISILRKKQYSIHSSSKSLSHTKFCIIALQRQNAVSLLLIRKRASTNVSWFILPREIGSLEKTICVLTRRKHAVLLLHQFSPRWIFFCFYFIKLTMYITHYILSRAAKMQNFPGMKSKLSSKSGKFQFSFEISHQFLCYV